MNREVNYFLEFANLDKESRGKIEQNETNLKEIYAKHE